MSYKRKVDSNHAEVVKALRSVGAVVTDLSRAGDGVPDLLVSYNGQWVVVEVKDGNKPPSKRKLTKEQQEWHDSQMAQPYIVYGPKDAIRKVTGAINAN